MTDGDEVMRLRVALSDAIEGMGTMLPYVPEYFREKWALDDFVDRAVVAFEINLPPSDVELIERRLHAEQIAHMQWKLSRKENP